MPAEKYRIDNPAFNEFVYAVLFNASFEAKRVIPPRLLKYVKSQREAKKFISRATIDEAHALLSYLGIEHFLVFVAKDNANLKDLKSILDKFKADKKITSLQDIIDKKLFVTSDKELITLLGLVAQTIHHKSYTMNLELTKTGYHIHGWGKHLDQSSITEIQENSNVLAKTLLSDSLTLNKVGFLFNLRPLDMQILLYLYPIKHTYTTISQLFLFFAGPVHKMKIASSVKSLVQTQHLQKSAISRVQEFTITALGVRVVNEYMEAVLHANSFR